MLKKSILIIIIIICSIVCVSCNMFSSATDKYLKAFEITSGVKSLNSKTECRISIDASKASPELKNRLEPFKEVSFNIDQATDNMAKKSETRVFIDVGEIMMDMLMYCNHDRVLLKSIITGNKYISLIPKLEKLEEPPVSENYYKYEKLYEELAVIWKESIKNEILSKEGSMVKNTPDGDIKVTQLSLELTDERAKAILGKLADFLSRDEIIKEMFVESGIQYINDSISHDRKIKVLEDMLEKLPETIKELEDKFLLEKLKFTARIDRDYYIIDETVEMRLLIKDPKEIRIGLVANTTRWNINRPVEVNVPEVYQDELIDISEFDFKDSDVLKESIMKKISQYLNGI
ncbi:MAG: hypothetical protein ACOX7R_10185 [Acetivibrionales bacterium]|jgi:hypothetical protein